MADLDTNTERGKVKIQNQNNTLKMIGWILFSLFFLFVLILVV